MLLGFIFSTPKVTQGHCSAVDFLNCSTWKTLKTRIFIFKSEAQLEVISKFNYWLRDWTASKYVLYINWGPRGHWNQNRKQISWQFQTLYANLNVGQLIINSNNWCRFFSTFFLGWFLPFIMFMICKTNRNNTNIRDKQKTEKPVDSWRILFLMECG